MKLVIYIVIAIFLGAWSKSNLRFNMNRIGLSEDGSTIQVELATYRKGSRTIHLFDMVHVGPKDYYQSVNSEIEKLSEEYPNSVVFSEGVHCSGPVLDLNNVSAFSPKLYETLVKLSRMPRVSITRLAKYSTEELASLYFDLLTGAINSDEFLRVKLRSTPEADKLLAIRHCENDDSPSVILPGTKAASYLDDMWLERCKFARQDHLACQLEELSFPDRLKVTNADLDVTKVSPYRQLVFALYVGCSALGDGCGDLSAWIENQQDELSQQFLKSVIEIKQKVRNSIIGDSLEGFLEDDNYLSAILPWGASHHTKFSRKFVEEHGFDLEKTVKIDFASCDDRQRYPSIAELFKVCGAE